MKKQQNIQASVLDRLIDLEPEISHEPVQYRLVSFGQIRASVIRDLEFLLNTKRQILTVPTAMGELNNSLFVYGIGDFTSQNPRSTSVRNELRKELALTIARFEPRLKNVTVDVVTPSQTERNLKLRIKGTLIIDPIAEPVEFDTYFDINRGQYIISR